MQTNERLFTDRNLLRPAPTAVSQRRPFATDDDAARGVLEALAHAALVLILVGAMILSASQPGASAPAASHSTASVVAEAVPAGSSAVNHCL